MVDHEIVVVGSGVIGLTTALALSRAGHDVAIITAESPVTVTSPIAAAFWLPYLCHPVDRAIQWSATTYAEVARLAQTDPSCGVLQLPLEAWFSGPVVRPWWADAVPAYERIDPVDLPSEMTHGYRITSYVLDTTRYLPWLAERCREEGISTTVQTLHTFDDLCGVAEMAVNCTGLGARELANDPSVTPVRGQVLRLAPLNLHHISVIEATTTHVTPRTSDVIAGGTAQPGRWDTEVDPDDTQAILRRVAPLLPVNSRPEILDVLVGLRPSRPTVRLELDSTSHRLPIIHNYGHGGAGFTTSWGCAHQVVATVATFTMSR